MTRNTFADETRSELTLRIPAGSVDLQGSLSMSPGSSALVVFVHGSGSSRFSPRNKLVAETLRVRGLGTLLFDLLTEEEARDSKRVFDIALLAARVIYVIRWLIDENLVPDLRIGLFGASTGAAAALVAAAEVPEHVKAVVSRGGRPDLAREYLMRVIAPTLLIVGAEDREVLMLNRQAYDLLHCKKKIAVVAGATHLFEESGTLEDAANEAADWFAGLLLSDRPATAAQHLQS